MAFISQMLEQYPQAEQYYNQIASSPTIEESIYQASNFQLAEVIYISNEKKLN